MTLEVRRWLEANGLGRYGELFESQQIDGDALRALTDAHLRELGIPLGPRARLMHAIARLAPPGDQAAAERRQLTVMFVDLEGSTPLSGRLDPEDLRKVIRGYQSAVAVEVTRFEGHVTQYLGDGVLAHFGYPVAHEDDAERAVRAALAIVEAVARRSAPGGEALAARIGIATGLVVVGDLIGEEGAKERAMVGETPNLAARLQGLAAPGEVVVSARTRTLIGRLFELRHLGPRHLKGFDGPVVAHAVVGARSLESRFEARRAGRVPAMVGRDEELALLERRWRQAAAGAGHLTLLTGEAGIGKSRILRALQDVLTAEPHVRLTYQCSPYRSDSALFPVVEQLTRATGIKPGDSAEAKLDRLEALLAPSGPGGASDAAPIAALLGIDAAQRYGPPQLTPRQQRARTFAALIGQLGRLAEHQPVLLVVEDAHWIDPTTLELVDLTLERLARMRVLILVTARPDFKHDFGPRTTRLALNRLERPQVTAIANRVAGGKSLPGKLMDEIVAKTDGVPLFVEEFTHAMLESGVLRETQGAYVLNGAPQASAVPSTLRDSLMARLDRLQPIKEVAQTAACIGRQFDQALLTAVSPLAPEALRTALARLVDAELVFRVRSGQGAQYSFKHALVCDAAYESLLKERRQHIHARLVLALEAAPGSPPELIAQHASRAQLPEKAIDYWQRAGAEAIARPAYAEAIAHLTQALALAERMSDLRAWQERRLLLLITLGQACIPLRGYGHPQTVEAFSRAQALADAMREAPHRFPIFYAIWAAHYVRGEQDKALETARRMIDQAEQDRNAGHRLTALRSLAISQAIAGSPTLACSTFEQAQQVSAASPPRSRGQRIATADRFANDPEIGTQIHYGYTLWCLGQVGRGRRVVAESLAAARTLGHAHTLCHALSYSSMLAALSRYADEAFALNGEACDLAERHDLDMLKAYGDAVAAFVLAMRGDLAASASRMQSGLVRLAGAHAGTTVCFFRAVQARTLAALGRWGDAEQHARQVHEELRTGSERYYWPECQRLLGDYLGLRHGGDAAAVESAYGDALTIARGQGASTWALYAALSLARWWAERGEHAKVRDVLAPLRNSLTEATGLPAVDEADALLQERRV